MTSFQTVRYRHWDEPQRYAPILEEMRAFTLSRTPETSDEIWFLEHEPVFTQGQAGKPEHLLVSSDIPVVQSCRGGQITYHGPGQLIVYPLLDLNRRGLDIRQLVTLLENTTIATLKDFGINAHTQKGAPGVYVDGQKIASVGLRVRLGRSFHGLALNTRMDLSPFGQINPCGYRDLKMTQVADFEPSITVATIKVHFLEHLMGRL